MSGFTSVAFSAPRAQWHCTSAPRHLDVLAFAVIFCFLHVSRTIYVLPTHNYRLKFLVLGELIQARGLASLEPSCAARVPQWK